MRESLVRVAEDVHAISRQLHPSILDDLGLVDAVRSECGAFYRREGILLDYHHEDLPDPISKKVSLCLFRIIQESLRNISKHARTKHASVSLSGDDAGRVRLEISDQGRGFDPGDARKKHGLGLISIEERVRMIDEELEVEAAPGKGTRIRVCTPAKEPKESDL